MPKADHHHFVHYKSNHTGAYDKDRPCRSPAMVAARIDSTLAHMIGCKRRFSSPMMPSFAGGAVSRIAMSSAAMISLAMWIYLPCHHCCKILGIHPGMHRGFILEMIWSWPLVQNREEDSTSQTLLSFCASLHCKRLRSRATLLFWIMYMAMDKIDNTDTCTMMSTPGPPTYEHLPPMTITHPA